jgi:hypothetical protein
VELCILTFFWVSWLFWRFIEFLTINKINFLNLQQSPQLLLVFLKQQVVLCLQHGGGRDRVGSQVGVGHRLCDGGNSRGSNQRSSLRNQGGLRSKVWCIVVVGESIRETVGVVGGGASGYRNGCCGKSVRNKGAITGVGGGNTAVVVRVSISISLGIGSSVSFSIGFPLLAAKVDERLDILGSICNWRSSRRDKSRGCVNNWRHRVEQRHGLYLMGHLSGDLNNGLDDRDLGNRVGHGKGKRSSKRGREGGNKRCGNGSNHWGIGSQ